MHWLPCRIWWNWIMGGQIWATNLYWEWFRFYPHRNPWSTSVALPLPFSRNWSKQTLPVFQVHNWRALAEVPRMPRQDPYIDTDFKSYSNKWGKNAVYWKQWWIDLEVLTQRWHNTGSHFNWSDQYVGWSQLLLPCSMMLINSLLAHASDARWEEFISELERLNVRKAVVVGDSLVLEPTFFF